MSPNAKSPVSEVLMLPVLLLVAFAAWMATFLSGTPTTRH